MNQRTAQLLSRLGHPFLLLAAASAALAAVRPQDPDAWLVLAVGDFGLPGLWLAWGLHAGWWRDPDVADRAARLRFLIPVALVTLVVAALLTRMPATTLTRHLALVAAAWTLSFTVITRWWQISFHAAGAAGLTVFLWLHFRQPAWMLLGIPALAVGWSRLVLQRHTPAQVAAGALLGLVFPFLWH
ncbi:putative PAP2 superfamily protein [Candidatus Hydrogenisulfobacillus filiaventi]|uniref:Putative PAP2 superfamily protein n=1 Tax=Candidatus Hydrogenisulfobacillus filiaventi TaxID=2707344 RepID=A0A6F8ZD05_9FIRM|nr:putative PAP2 superfamily protein [Candidatus Hydrogenisulfobacillus filiaventi]